MAESRQICCKYAPAYRFHRSRSYQRSPLTDQYVENGISGRYAVFTFQHITQPKSNWFRYSKSIIESIYIHTSDLLFRTVIR